jgi:adenosylcobinamide-phosphate synthase
MDGTQTLLLLAAAMGLEMLVGYPARLFDLFRHPVVWMGALIDLLDKRLNLASDPAPLRRRAGFIALGVLIAVTAVLAELVQSVLLRLPFGIFLVAILASTLIASRSLEEHVRAVATGLAERGLNGGRQAVSMIVGRNTATLDRHGVARAAIESLAENFSDGVVAPTFYLGIFGLPGAAVYKAINTADSMIGHRTPRHEAFGYASARLDDFVNLPASRLSVLFIVIAAWIMPGADPKAAWTAAWRDARFHRSPNAGWPEAAFAGALGLRLNGPKIYGDVPTADAYMGDGRADATEADIFRALNLFRIACLVPMAAVLSVLALAALL